MKQRPTMLELTGEFIEDVVVVGGVGQRRGRPLAWSVGREKAPLLLCFLSFREFDSVTLNQ